jgi:retron-type reverse transcriptase
LRFTSLWHHVYNVDRLRLAYKRLKRRAAPGVDGETWRHYGEDLEANLQDLSGRLRRGAYRAKPVKRTYIPKADGRERPIGIPALEDKIVQRASVETPSTRPTSKGSPMDFDPDAASTRRWTRSRSASNGEK